jgi:hydrogenase expression/formation protein HypC
MCLGIPGRVVEILDEDLLLAKAVEVGDWVLIHVGFAMSKLDEVEAQATLQALQELGDAYEAELEELRASQIE